MKFGLSVTLIFGGKTGIGLDCAISTSNIVEHWVLWVVNTISRWKETRQFLYLINEDLRIPSYSLENPCGQSEGREESDPDIQLHEGRTSTWKSGRPGCRT